MARTVTLSSLRDQIRQRGEWRSVWIPANDTNLNLQINQSIAELYDLLVSVNQDYYLSSSDITVQSGTGSYALPSDFYKVIGVDYSDSGSWVDMERFNWTERNDRTSYTNALSSRYRVSGSNIMFEPTPAWGGTVRLWYIPCPTALSGDSSTFDGIAGWEEYVIVDVAAKLAIAEESDPNGYLLLKNAQVARITSMASERDYGKADRITDVYRARGRGRFGFYDI